MSIKIERSRNITNVSALDPKVRLQMATSVCVSDFKLIKCRLKIESSRNITNVSAIDPEVRLQIATSVCASDFKLIKCRL